MTKLRDYGSLEFEKRCLRVQRQFIVPVCVCAPQVGGERETVLSRVLVGAINHKNPILQNFKTVLLKLMVVPKVSVLLYTKSQSF